MAAKKSESGQALVEFIIFLPFMLMMYTVVVSLGDAIYGSINQQKATRAYFYFRIKNNSQISKPQYSGASLINDTWTQFGHFFIGWANELRGDDPFMPCYRLNLPFAPASGDSCDDSYSNLTTQFVRVGTVYGVCGASIRKGTTPGEFIELPGGGSDPDMVKPVTTMGSCYIQ